MIRIQREAKSRLSVDVVSVEDPSAANVYFAFPPRGERPATFVAGAWLGDAVQDGGAWRREAVTPRIGEGSLDLEAGHYRLFGRLVNNLDEDVWEVDPEGLEVQ